MIFRLSNQVKPPELPHEPRKTTTIKGVSDIQHFGGFAVNCYNSLSYHMKCGYTDSAALPFFCWFHFFVTKTCCWCCWCCPVKHDKGSLNVWLCVCAHAHTKDFRANVMKNGNCHPRLATCH